MKTGASSYQNNIDLNQFAAGYEAVLTVRPAEATPAQLLLAK